MRFWDSSAIVPTLIEEPTSAAMLALLDDDPLVTAWWATPVECTSAIVRRERSGALPEDGASESLAALESLASAWSEIPPSSAARYSARRLVRAHELRAADAFQLAAARIASSEQPEYVPFVTLDARLALAAAREGFPVLPG